MDNTGGTNSSKVLKYCAGKGWRRPVGNMCEKLSQESRVRGISYRKYKEGMLTGLVTSCGRTASYKTLLEER